MLKKYSKKLAEVLSRGDIAVLPTDTIYGICGSALNQKTVESIFAIRKRSSKKPFIVLIAGIPDIALFGVHVGKAEKNLFTKLWPGKTSILLPVRAKKFQYLHCGTKKIAFRIPAIRALRAFLRKTGPLVAPSANISGKSPARTAQEAKRYFGGKVKYYVDGGHIEGEPSTLIEIVRGKVKILRRGAVNVLNL